MKVLIMRFRFILAFYVGKLLMLVKLIAKDKGTNMPGYIALKICPRFLHMIDHPKLIIAVTGTNGKTSTADFINHILSKNGYTTMNNSKGSNMPSGISSSLLEASNIFGKVNKQVGIIEVDERASGFVYDAIKPTYLVCTNLFRDSIKRNGHSEFILTKIKSSVPIDTTLILNADDIISSSIGTDKNKKVYFAVDKLDTDTYFKNIVSDASVCPLCKSPLKYVYHHYHHIGSVYCPMCGFKSPKPDYLATKVDLNKLTFKVKENDVENTYKLISNSILNVYNLIAAIAVLRTMGLTHEDINKAIISLTLKKDRYDNNLVNNIEIIKMLSKDQNPISCSRMFDYVTNEPGNKAIILCITDSHDKVHGSEDISWLYDTDFEYLKHSDIKQVIACGTRSLDVLLRLKMAGIEDRKLDFSIDYMDVQDKILLKNIDKIFILYELYAYPLAGIIEKKIIERVGNNNDKN